MLAVMVIYLLGILFLNGILSLNIQEADNYLRRYGYLSSLSPTNDERTYALQVFQRFSGLITTGILDQSTITKMEEQRCGCPDVMYFKDDSQFTKKKNPPEPVEFNLGTAWRKKSLTWRLNSFSAKIPRNFVRSETIRAFKLWSDVADLTFTETSGDADIVIDFAVGQHGDGAGNAFDGRGRVLAHAFFPPFGDSHFDDDEAWVVNRTGTDYFTVAAHEFGHALGLGHSEVGTALMAPFYSGYNPDFKLDPDDIAGIQALYGPPSTQPRPTNRPLPTIRPPVTTPAPTEPPRTRRPRLCTMNFNAVVEDFNGDLLAFIGGNTMLRINNNGLVGRSAQSWTFFRSPRRPDAAFTTLAGSQVMFLKGQYLFRFRRGSPYRLDRRPRTISGGGSTMPEAPRAALSMSSNVVEVFGNSMLWWMNPNTGQVFSGTHKYIGDEYPGVPNTLDAAVRKNNNILFFKGDRMYIFDTLRGRVTREEDKADYLLPNNCKLDSS